VTVTDDMFDTLQLSGARLQRWPSSSVFFKPDGTPLGLGDTLVQPDLARSLTAIA
jgi:gamma-glutamyltranspeptidase/glutathione hydrolase